MTIILPTAIPIQKIPYVHKDYPEINHCINNLNDVIWNVAKGSRIWKHKEDKFAFFPISDISDNVVFINKIDGNILGQII